MIRKHAKRHTVAKSRRKKIKKIKNIKKTQPHTQKSEFSNWSISNRQCRAKCGKQHKKNLQQQTTSANLTSVSRFKKFFFYWRSIDEEKSQFSCYFFLFPPPHLSPTALVTIAV
ncbi:unnamed protein product [Ceratitis capitata]|uniref:(Mediterranean fruit fly) hypothetical protein n=1 Tax=Ceratitis capitata TaxID=7213 RepID=A0A811UFS7_CERCA|nr:unnamed protein product [Ceratitis capitata]